MRISVCLSVCIGYPLTKVENHTANFTNFLSTLPEAVTQSSAGSFAICYVLPVLWMTSRFHIVVPAGQNEA